MRVPSKSSILLGFSLINHPLLGSPIYGNLHKWCLFCWAFRLKDASFLALSENVCHWNLLIRGNWSEWFRVVWNSDAPSYVNGRYQSYCFILFLKVITTRCLGFCGYKKGILLGHAPCSKAMSVQQKCLDVWCPTEAWPLASSVEIRSGMGISPQKSSGCGINGAN